MTEELDTLPKYLKRNYELYGDLTALREKDYGLWKKLTWNEAYEQIKYFALGLVSLGLQPGEKVSIIGNCEPELFWSQFAVEAIRGVPVPLYPDGTREEIEFIVNDSDCVIAIAEDQEQTDKFLDLKDKLPLVRKVLYWDDKGMWSYDEWRVVFEKTLSPGAQYLTFISPAWATEQWIGIALGLILPMTVNFPEEPDTVQQNIREVAPEFVAFAPRQWEGLVSKVEARMLDASWMARLVYRMFMSIGYNVARAKAEGKRVGIGLRLLNALGEVLLLRPIKDRLGLTNIKVAVTGGTSISPEIFWFFHALGVEMRHAYGISEVGVLTCHRDNAMNFDSVGQVVSVDPKDGPPLEIRISEEEEVLVRGGSFFQGYYENPEAGAKKLDKGGWYHTGDSGHFTDDTHLIFLDRLEDLRTLSNGYKYSPQYIEIRLRHSPFIRDVIVLGDEEKSFVSTLVDLDIETVGRWAEKKSIPYTTFAELSQIAEVRGLIAQEVIKLNQKLPPQSQLRRFANLHKPLDPDEGDLTRTRKLRRTFVEARYSDMVEAIYGDKNEFHVETAVKYQDGRAGVITAEIVIMDMEEIAHD